MRASIIVPTYNRAAVLQVCLEAIAALHTDPTAFEVIVADNNSTDATFQVCQAVAATHPTLRLCYVFEAVQGVSHARNRAVAEACGEIVCFLDDDSPPAADWLDALLLPFADPAVGCAGGPSIPDYQGAEVPAWLRGDLQGLLSGYGLPYDVPTPVHRWEELPLSCNMAIRRELFAELGSFRTDLDRRGNQVLAAGDTEMADRIAKAGRLVIYVPDARVHHLVPPQRLTKAHVYRIGRGLAESHIILTSGTGALGVVRWFASDGWYATRMGGRLLSALLRQEPLWFDDYMRFWMVAQRIPLRVRSLLGPHAG